PASLATNNSPTSGNPPSPYHLTEILGMLGGDRLKLPVMEKWGNFILGVDRLFQIFLHAEEISFHFNFPTKSLIPQPNCLLAHANSLSTVSPKGSHSFCHVERMSLVFIFELISESLLLTVLFVADNSVLTVVFWFPRVLLSSS